MVSDSGLWSSGDILAPSPDFLVDVQYWTCRRCRERIDFLRRNRDWESSGVRFVSLLPPSNVSTDGGVAAQEDSSSIAASEREVAVDVVEGELTVEHHN